jgi:signal transduction histidine kinase
MTDRSRTEHDLKNHLAIVLGYAELLLQEADPGDPRRADFEEIHRAASAALELVSAPQEPTT